MLVHLPTLWTVLIDIALWLIIHFGVSWACSRPRPEQFDPSAWWYRERACERHGRIYEILFNVKAWKGWLPDGAALFRNGFRKKKLRDTGPEYVRLFIQETCRAELTHWISFAFAPLFFIWNLWWVGLIMIAYAVAANGPCIITQRYNRIRLASTLKNRA
jgi:glycosyl-4,4'-diaponeurosporenoate acyltransferase